MLYHFIPNSFLTTSRTALGRLFLLFMTSAVLFPTVGFCTEGDTFTEDAMAGVLALFLVSSGIYVMSDPKARQHRFFRVLIASSFLALTSCATPGQSVMLGAGIGAAGGAGFGLAVEQSPGSALIGAGIGMVVSGGIAYLWHKNREREEERIKAIRTSGRTEPNDPMLSAPEVRREWVPDSVQGNTLVRGHWRYVIDRQSSWGDQ